MEIKFINWIKGRKKKIDNKDIDPYEEEIWDDSKNKNKILNEIY